MSKVIELRPWLDHLQEQVPVAVAGKDPEGVHQVRVSIARLRVWLQIAGHDRLDSQLRKLRVDAARVRDLDVLLARKLPRRYALALTAERAEAQRSLVRALEGRRLGRVVKKLEALPPLSRSKVERALRRSARRALAMGKSVEWGHFAAVHELRRGVRRVRFTVEWLGQRSHPLEKLQSALGDVCDLHVALDHARGSRHPHLRGHRRRLKRDLRAKKSAARRAWRHARAVLKATIAAK